MESLTIRSGTLRHLVQVQAPVDTPDGQGGFTRSWATIAEGSVWASIEPVSGKEVFTWQQLNLRVSHKVTMRYVAGVTAAMRIIYGARVFNIRTVRNLQERNKMLVLLCEEGVPG